MKVMKKLFALVMIAVLSLGLVPVNAEAEVKVNKIEKKWEEEYKIAGYQITGEEVAATEEGIYAVGYFGLTPEDESTDDGDVNGLDVLEKNEHAAFLIKYDHDGKVLWEKTYRDPNVYFSAVSEVSDGIVVLVEEYKTRTVSLFKYDTKGNIVSKKVILENYIIENYGAIKMESYNDNVVVSFDNYLFAFNSKTSDVKSKTYNVNSEYKLDTVVTVDINENGIYAGYIDYGTTYSTLVRYNYDLTGELVSEYKVQGGVVTALSVINGNVVAGVMTPDDVSKLVILDKELVLVKDSTIAGKTKFYDFAETRDGFAAVMVNAVEESTDPLEPADPVDPQDPQASLTGRKENDVKAVSVINFYGIKFYNNNLTEYLPAVELTANVTRIESTVGGLVYCGDTYADDEYADYNLSIAKFGYEEYAYDVKANENGEVAVTKSENGKWQVVVTPKEGYQVSKVIVTNSEGSVEYTSASFEADMDDVTIEVIYEPIPSNPNTGLSNPYIILGIVLVAGIGGYSFLKKKKYI